MTEYSVVVGNIGVVHVGKDKKDAIDAYELYIRLSDLDVGRAGGEAVAFFIGDDLEMEHAGKRRNSS
jgi:hypothetical protein